MKTIEVDEDLYRYIASHTQKIGESASDILRRLLGLTENTGSLQSENGVAEKGEKVATVADYSEKLNALLVSENYLQQKSAVNRFLSILSFLYQMNKSEFDEIVETLHGRTRIYFALNETILLTNGNETKPRSIPDTPYWVITNTNTGRKRSILEHIMSVMQFPPALIARVCETI